LNGTHQPLDLAADVKLLG